MARHVRGAFIQTKERDKKIVRLDKGVGREQAGRVMKEFYHGKLRAKNEGKVTNVEQAKAIAMSEGRAAEARGVKKRTWKGRTRIRPRLKG